MALPSSTLRRMKKKPPRLYLPALGQGFFSSTTLRHEPRTTLIGKGSEFGTWVDTKREARSAKELTRMARALVLFREVRKEASHAEVKNSFRADFT
jgi:hypothetical protein